MSTSKPKLYLETTVPSYYAARPSSDVILAGHQHVTRIWWEAHRSRYAVFVSDLVIQEASRGDKEAAVRRSALLAKFPVLGVNQAAIDLARVYLQRLPIPSTAAADALHLALATIHDMDYLLTWNCSHIARGSVIRALPAINMDHRFSTPTICTPEELIYENREDLD